MVESLSPFASLDAAFRLLCEGPRPLGLDGETIGARPGRVVSMVELRQLLLARSCSHEVRNAAVGAVVARAQSEGGAWMVAAAGLLLPGMARVAYPLVRAYRGHIADIETEMLTGLVDGIRRADPATSGVAARLVWKSRRAAEPLVRAERIEKARTGLLPPASMEPPQAVWASEFGAG